MWVMDRSGLLKMVPFDWSYWSAIVSDLVRHLSYLTLQNVVTLTVHSRPLEITPCNRSHSTHCNYLYLVPFLTYSTLNNGLPLDNWVSGHSGSPINAVATHLIQVAKAPHDKKFECQVHMQGRTLLQQMSDKSLPHLFTEEEISAALQKTKPATAPGYDNIHVEFLKNLGPKARTWLSKFFSRIMATHSIPKIWRKAKVIAVENVVKI